MPRTAREISQSIRATLKLLDPSISADPLTPERKIIDTVAETIAESSIDSFVLSYQFDVDTKVGSDLDQFVALFGFARQRARRATGFVTFSKTTPAVTDILVPIGTQVVKPTTTVSVPVTFVTTAPVVLPVGGTTVEAPIEATIDGILGNVPANTIVSLGAGSPNDISEVANDNATNGGAEAETDAALRIRFKNTIFRNIAGTQDQFLALAVASKYANKANVLGPISRFIEYAQVPASLIIASQIPYSKYTYNFDYYITNGNLDSEVFYQANGVDYTFTSAVPPTITVNNVVNLPINTVILFEHSYCSANSRNDPANNINNLVDVYVSGQNAVPAIESVRMVTSASVFTGDPGSPFYINNFQRVETGIKPVSGNRFQELLWQPVVGLPATIAILDDVYRLNEHYWLIRDTTIYKGSKRARNGIEWSGTVTSGVPDNTDLIVEYIFDKLPIMLNELMDAHKQVTTDVLVHSAIERFFIVNLIVMYSPGFDSTNVNTALDVALTNYMESLNFGAMIQISDILDVAHDVPGIDNVRIAVPTDGVAYGVQEVAADGTSPLGTPHTTDFAIQDSDLAILQAVQTTRRSQNTW